jgi:metallo-beta-lactamase class B
MKRLSVYITIFLFGISYKGFTQTSHTKDTVYQSDQLIITRLSKHSYVHTSYLYTNSFGKVPCNGMIVLNKNEAVVFDTPANDTSTTELICWLQQKAQSTIKAIIPTHFHEDCLGGLKAFHQYKVSSYANKLTIALAKAQQYPLPVNGFSGELMLTVGGEKIYTRFFGEGHTKDNVVGYFPTDQILFGGCLIKELDATKGFLGDANVKAWSATVEKIKKNYSALKIVIPGHGEPGNQALLDYTIRLFSKE